MTVVRVFTLYLFDFLRYSLKKARREGATSLQSENKYLALVQKELEKRVLFDETATSELVKQYTAHQKFLLSALTDKEELRSRVAFVDVYRKEFDALHEKLQGLYGTEKGAFSYLKDPAFLQRTVYTRWSWFGLKKDRLYLPDMMKDYLTYLYVNGKIKPEEYKEIFKDQPDEGFRTQEIINDKKNWNFLIDDSTNLRITDAQKEALRECRKWMYRNCPKGGVLNNTGHKRNYIDAFGKKPLRVQLDTLFLLQNKLYLDGAEDLPLPQDFAPELKLLRKKMTYSKLQCINPFHLWRKFSGSSLKWERMEKALKKAERREQARRLAEKSRASLVQKSANPALLSVVPKGANINVKETQFQAEHSAGKTFESGSDAALITKGVVLFPVDTYSAAYSFLSGTNPSGLKAVDIVSGLLAILGSAFSAIYSGARAKESANNVKKAAQIKGKSKSKENNPYQKNEQGRLHDMAKISETRNGEMLKIYSKILSYNTTWLLFAIPAFFGVCTTVFGVIGGVISVIGGGLGLWLYRTANKKTAEKAVILAMKAEDKEYLQKKESNSSKSLKKDKYIQPRLEIHRKMLKNKKNRLNPAWGKIVTDYMKCDCKMKDRVLENWSVQHGYATIYSVLARKDTEHIIKALRYLFLKDPNGEIDDDNLIKSEEDAKRYFSDKEQDLKQTGQIKETVQTRIAYRDLLETNRIDTAPVHCVGDVFKRMNILPDGQKGKTAA